jgi:hypothetical protein
MQTPAERHLTQQEKPPAQAPARDIQTSLDRVLTTHGAYVPVELLLTLGRLRYTDYEAWRSGACPTLQSVLVGDARHAVALLNEAADWAETPGLLPERQVYFGWGEIAGQRLAFCDDGWSDADAVLATHYVRPAVSDDGSQLDIFLDSGPVAALQDLRAALCARDPRGAERSLANLASKAPGHRLLPAAARLTDMLADLAASLLPEATESELHTLEHILLPTAQEVLGSDARDLLAAFWRRLADALAGVPFDPERPALHASYAYSRCPDWRRAVAAVEAVPNHPAEPALLARLAVARRRAGNRNGAIEALCLLCWHFPTAAETLLDDAEIPEVTLHQAWIEFRDIDLDPPPETCLFPAWYLLTEPGLAHTLASDRGTGDNGGESAFRAVRRLLDHDCIEARKAVRAAEPWLLEAYLQLHP